MASWENGDSAEYTLAIMVPGEPQTEPTLPPLPPDLRLPIDSATSIDGILGSLCWAGDCGDGLPPQIETFTSLSVGTPLRLEFAGGPIPDSLDLTLFEAP